jgi:hypothetical protein
MGLFNDIFLSKKEKHVIDIYNSISNYWKNSNDFVVAHIRYLQDLNFKYKLNLSNEIVFDLPILLLTPLIERGLSQNNSMFIFSQFIGFFIFKNDKAKISRYSDEIIFEIVTRINKILIPYKSHVTPEFSYQIDKDYDVLSEILEINIRNVDLSRSERNKELSMNILASRNNCSPNMVKHKIFEQLDKMGVTIEMIKSTNLIYSNVRFVQADLYNMHHDDTPAALFIKINEDYIERLKSDSNDDQIDIDIPKNGHPESDKNEDDLPF